MLPLLVTVVIPTYNRVNIIKRAINSVQDQTYQNYELLVVDDFSDDNTKNIVTDYDDSRVNYILNERKKGAQGARNTGIIRAQGKYIAFLDSDDKWLPNKLCCQVEEMEKLNEQYALIYCGLNILNGDKISSKIPELEGDIYKKVLGFEQWHPPTSTFFVRTKVAKKMLFDEAFPAFQERDFLLRISREYKIAQIQEPMVQKYDSNDNIHQGKNVIYGLRLLMVKYKHDIKRLNLQEKYLRFLAGNYLNRLNDVKMCRILLSMPDIKKSLVDLLFLCLARFGYLPAKLFSSGINRVGKVLVKVGIRKINLF